MSEQIELPDYLKDITDDTAKDLVTSSGSAPRISIRGRQFRFIVDKEEVTVQTDPIHVIVIGVVPENGMAHTFYISGYQPGSSDPPDCSSFFGEVPDSWCSSPQAQFCKDCPNQVWGSAKSMSGGKAKACKDSKRLLVINAKDVKEEEPMVFLLNVTIASLRALSDFGKFLISNKLPMAAVITEIAFVDSEFPQVDFTFKGVLAKEVGTRTLEWAQRKEWNDTKPIVKIEGPASSKQIMNDKPLTNPPPLTDGDAPVEDADPLSKW